MIKQSRFNDFFAKVSHKLSKNIEDCGFNDDGSFYAKTTLGDSFRFVLSDGIVWFSINESVAHYVLGEELKEEQFNIVRFVLSSNERGELFYDLDCFCKHVKDYQARENACFWFQKHGALFLAYDAFNGELVVIDAREKKLNKPVKVPTNNLLLPSVIKNACVKMIDLMEFL
nr:MAG TPA: hypothetical protein [Caudoviricetes sp.]